MIFYKEIYLNLYLGRELALRNMTMIRNTERPFSNRNGGNEKGVERVKWSSFSPDLNLIDEKRKGKK